LVHLLTILTLNALGVLPSAGQVIVNLMDNATVQANGTYTYYSGATGTPFTSPFYPGPTLHGSGVGDGYKDGSFTDSGSNGAAISIGSGELTAGTSGNIAGWQGVVNANGQFDILFNLGGLYRIGQVIINYQDMSGYRWDAAAGAQQVYTAASLAAATPANADFTLYGTGTVTGSTTANMTITNPGDISAQYVLLRLDVSAAGGSNYGGILRGVRVFGYAVPEPGSATLLVAGLALIFTQRRRLDRRNR
jgi:hypothetical protein